MQGLYIHIPFCKSRCIYCDFYSTTNLDLKSQYITALCREVGQRNDYLPGRTLKTIYLGGGTPSLLTTEDIEQLTNKIKSIFNISPDYEFTIEANPGDITHDRLQAWHKLGINRISLGIQTFNDLQLQFLHRRHTGLQAIQAVRLAQQAGFDNISIDLIYGLPNQTIQDLKNDIHTALQLNIQHISTYCLTYEPETPLYTQLQHKHVRQTDDDTLNYMYEMLITELTNHGFIHYEVSNFCLPDKYSRHNNAYWTGEPYLGIGAAAHSYNQKTRQYNENNLKKYIDGTHSITIEHLTPQDHYNEFVMLRLRTAQGIYLPQLNDIQRQYCIAQAQRYIAADQLIIQDNYLKINRSGWHILDRITADLMQ